MASCCFNLLAYVFIAVDIIFIERKTYSDALYLGQFPDHHASNELVPLKGTVFELAAQIVVERRQRVLPVYGRNALDLELFYLAFNLLGVDTLVDFVHSAYEKVRAHLLELDVVLAEERDFVVFEARRDGENERVVEVVLDGFVEQFLLDLGKLLAERDVEVLAVKERNEVICLRMLVQRL